MTLSRERRSAVLVIDDVEETRRGAERLLAASGYQVSAARDEAEAILQASRHPPDLILISPGVDPTGAVAIARRMRERAGLSDDVPVVFFCVTSLEEGAEVEIGDKVYMTRPDNFDQLRVLLSRLLQTPPRGC